MAPTVRFLGAAQNVTGSCYLVETNGSRVLVDCGMYQERELRSRNWDPFPVPPGTIDAIVLTHSHIDHSGLIPKLVRDGFKGRIFCTPATAEIAKIMLLDSAEVQEEDAAYKKRRHQREGRTGPYPEIPLYTRRDALDSYKLFEPSHYGLWTSVAPGIEAVLYDAGHVLGCAFVRLEVGTKGSRRSIVFSGDVGRFDKPVLADPSAPGPADYIVVESTYGDRLHNEARDLNAALVEVINSTVEKGGNLLIPSFALERTQDLIFRMKRLLAEKRIPEMMVFLDSPMAARITEVFEDHPEYLDEDVRELFSDGGSPFDFPGLVTVRNPETSKSINKIRGSVVIIAGAGMCTGGRIKHHLTTNISRPESTIMFVGYQAEGTLGRQILDGNPEVRVLGNMYPVRARIIALQGFSAHADRDELLRGGWPGFPRCRSGCSSLTESAPPERRSPKPCVSGSDGRWRSRRTVRARRWTEPSG